MAVLVHSCILKHWYAYLYSYSISLDGENIIKHKPEKSKTIGQLPVTHIYSHPTIKTP